MTRDELYSLRKGCRLRRVQRHSTLPESATYLDWTRTDAYFRVIRDPDGQQHYVTDHEMCALYEVD